MAKKKIIRRMRRIYYGPPGCETKHFWPVEVSDAKTEVEMNGCLLNALKGQPGTTIGCALSNVGADNINAFPHPVHLISITGSSALVVDKLDRTGAPCHAVLYRHSYGRHIVDRNDERTLKKIVKEDPSVIERSFTLKPPYNRRKTVPTTHPNAKGATSKKAFAHRGVLRRAQKAGLISSAAARHLADIAAGGSKSKVDALATRAVREMSN